VWSPADILSGLLAERGSGPSVSRSPRASFYLIWGAELLDLSARGIHGADDSSDDVFCEPCNEVVSDATNRSLEPLPSNRPPLTPPSCASAAPSSASKQRCWSPNLLEAAPSA
jgi:hypothetical protein